MTCYGTGESSAQNASSQGWDPPFCGSSSFLAQGLCSHPETDGAGGAESAAQAEKPLVPTSAADWEAKKDIIQQLYMEKNLILNDVMDIMTKDHKFKATARMYKGQFAKWKWTKYNKNGNTSTMKSAKSRVGKKRGSSLSSTAGDQSSQTQLPPHLVSDKYNYETSLTAYKSMIASWSTPEHESPWRLSSYSSHSSYSSQSILQQIRTSLNHFLSQNNPLAGQVLRDAFLRIESTLSTPDATFNVEVIWDICLAVPQLTLSFNFPDILYHFTNHVASLAALKLSPSHPITVISSTLAHLASLIQHSGNEEALHYLKTYITNGWNLWIDLSSSQRGMEDHVTIHLRRGYAVLIEDFDPPKSGEPILPEDFEQSLVRSFGRRGMVRTMIRILELEGLLKRMYLPLITVEKAERGRLLLESVVERKKEKEKRFKGVERQETILKSFHGRYLVFSARLFMASISDYMGNYERGKEMRRKSLDMDDDMEGERDLFWMQTAFMVLEGLKGENKEEEAREIEEEMRRCGWEGNRTVKRIGEEGGEVVPWVRMRVSGSKICELNGENDDDDNDDDDDDNDDEHDDDDEKIQVDDDGVC
ncbi:hypothetical protein QBC38DRAFT_364390 [Podospora fimiseda]|uniref:Clr5 domain-containing protein n=1 Tax=Podospora fimiseda TaxID=252190 RepID=A0AAN7H4Q0_9PEZI|nr:hypothetical protein QBC38DRAFT_364390 [Podospora fimiseda]